MTKIERRLTRIRRIRARINRTKNLPLPLPTNDTQSDEDLNARYSVGKTQNSPIHILTFVAEAKAVEDPAIIVFCR